MIYYLALAIFIATSIFLSRVPTVFNYWWLIPVMSFIWFIHKHFSLGLPIQFKVKPSNQSYLVFEKQSRHQQIEVKISGHVNLGVGMLVLCRISTKSYGFIVFANESSSMYHRLRIWLYNQYYSADLSSDERLN